MSLIALFSTRLKALIREKSSLFIFTLCIIASLFAGRYSMQKQEGLLTLALVNEDTGEFGNRLSAMLEEEDRLKIVTTDVTTARRLLIQNRVQCLARIPQDFSDRIINREYRDLAELTVSADSTYSATVSEPLVAGIMKLWFEKQVIYDAEQFLQNKGLHLSSVRKQQLLDEMEGIWKEGSTVQVKTVVLTEESSASLFKPSDPALSWYAALIPFYLILSCGWMQQRNYFSLLRRFQQKGFPLALIFLTQAAASLVMGTTGFVVTALFGGSAFLLPSLLPHILLYGLGCLGMALVLSSVCRNDSILLLVAPTFTLAAAAISGLLLKLPDWASVWETVSRILPGRSFHEAMTGRPKPLPALLQTTVWLLAGLLFARFFSERKQVHHSR